MNNFKFLRYYNNHIYIYFFGLKIRVTKFFNFFTKYKNIKKNTSIQNSFDCGVLKKAKYLIVFFIPNQEAISGGILSIFSLCNYTRQISPSATTLIVTFPGKDTYTHNNFFTNNENIYRWKQIIQNANNVEQLILHIPEYLSKYFYASLSCRDKVFLNKIQYLHINIMNQNIELMPKSNEIKELYMLTNTITQTLAFSKNLNQNLSNIYKMPIHLFSTWLDCSKYKTTTFSEKEKIIAVSPDNNIFKQNILEKIAQELPYYKIVVIKNLKFDDYMNLISKSFAVITFGEGFDWFFMQPIQVGTISFSVFNKNFFPNKSWKTLPNVFSSYDELKNNIIKNIKELSNNSNKYYEIINRTHTKISEIYSEEKYKNNLIRFYNHDYDIYPEER